MQILERLNFNPDHPFIGMFEEDPVPPPSNSGETEPRLDYTWGYAGARMTQKGMSVEQWSKEVIGKTLNPFSFNEGSSTNQYYPISQSSNMQQIGNICKSSRANSQNHKVSDLSKMFSKKLKVKSFSSNENSSGNIYSFFSSNNYLGSNDYCPYESNFSPGQIASEI